MERCRKFVGSLEELGEEAYLPPELTKEEAVVLPSSSRRRRRSASGLTTTST
jgi:hypothetical protein